MKESTYWDDIRIVQKTLDNYAEDGSFHQDFESVVEGMYPFVHGFTQTGDQVTHLAQLNAPYTQAGWNNRVISDVIDGEWSLEAACSSNRSCILYNSSELPFLRPEKYTMLSLIILQEMQHIR